MSNYVKYSGYYRQMQKERYKRDKEEGICTYCHKAPAEDGTTMCRHCRQVRSENTKKILNESPEKRSSVREQARKCLKNIRKERIEKHQCIVCGKPLAEDRTQRMCPTCADNYAQYQRNFRNRKRQEKERKED